MRVCRRASKRLEAGFLVGAIIFCSISLCLFLNLDQSVETTSHENYAFPGSQTSQYFEQETSFLQNKRGEVVASQSASRTASNHTNTSPRRKARNQGNKKKTSQIQEVRLKPVVTKQFTIFSARKGSSVDYFACCGAGHRLSKLVDAHYLATHLKFGLRVFFGFCDKQEVFSHFFGPQPLGELEKQVGGSNASRHFSIKVTNDVPGFVKMRREGPKAPCQCPKQRLNEDVTFYTSLRNRFRSKSVVEEFRSKHFANKTVIGMHVRAGNGEAGDFNNKNRSIATDDWAPSLAGQLLALSKHWENPPILFIATDTSSMITKFRELLGDRIPVIDFSQLRPEPGKGVFFGESLQVLNVGDTCLEGWESAFTDMMIISHADVLVAARPSSFTQSLPMTLVLSTNKARRKVLKSFCEVNPSASAMECYEDLTDWCCRGNTSFSLDTIQRFDYRRMPNMEYFKSNRIWEDVKKRPAEARVCIPTPRNPQRDCLPYDMPNKFAVEEAGRLFD